MAARHAVGIYATTEPNPNKIVSSLHLEEADRKRDGGNGN